MLPVLSREFLWTDLKTMDEFFKLDPVNEDFFEIFATLRKEPFGVQMDAVKIFNEVYYQVTRMAFEWSLFDDIPKYINDIKANIGWKYSAELVMTMAYFFSIAVDRRNPPINRYSLGSIKEIFSKCPYWEPFNKLSTSLFRKKRFINYSFPPRPNDIKDLQGKYFRWSVITQKYDLSCIEHVINLWSDVKDQREIALMIRASMSRVLGVNYQKTDIKQISRFIDRYLHEETKYEDSISNKIRIKLQATLNKNMLKRISELEAENTRLNTLLDKKKKTTGKDRKFTLLQIVDYCKGCFEWNDVKSIVAMLNKMLRSNATYEDSELVDSIESEFLKRQYGNTYINEQNIIPSVGNYKPQITTQNMNLALPSEELEDENLD